MDIFSNKRIKKLEEHVACLLKQVNRLEADNGVLINRMLRHDAVVLKEPISLPTLRLDLDMLIEKLGYKIVTLPPKREIRKGE
jgi:hypothetical protein